jgi:hypothetical protein
MSQTDLARSVREAGYKSGFPNGCTREMVQRWESGKVRKPQPRYLLLLENVLRQPVGSLGFDADARYEVDRLRARADARLDVPMPMPGPAEHYDGPLSGIWLSAYHYTSSGRGQQFTGRHYVQVLQRGAKLMVNSVPASTSQLSMDLSANGKTVTGTWAEQTEADGWYRGAVYLGAVQMIYDPAEHRMDGRWVGFGRENEVNTDTWSLVRVDEQAGPEAVARWDQVPDGIAQVPGETITPG